MNEFPPDWQTIHMREAATWLSGGTPSTSNPRYWDGDIPWISAASLKDFHVSDSERRVTSLGASHGTRLIPAGTTIFVVRGMSLKNEFRVGITCREVAFGQDCKALIPVAGIYPPFFAFALMGQSSSILKMVDEAGHGTGRLPTDQLLNLPIGIPSISEQKRIVEILDTADEAIRSTERLIVKLQQVKVGLLHDLLAANIGSLRRLGDTAKVTVGHVGPTESFYTNPDAGVVFLRTGNITDKGISLKNLRYVSEAFHKANHKSALFAGDVVISRVGYTGAAAVIPPLDEANCANMIIVRPGNIIDSTYLKLLFESEFVMRQVSAFTAGSAQPVLNIRLVQRLMIPVPPLSAQVELTDGAARIDVRLAAEERNAAKLRLLKQGLINDLMTGQVRVGTSA